MQGLVFLEDPAVNTYFYIRLKYDIFEDVCFEHYFDKAFDLCKGKYKTFYDEIENLGRCVYRRYQIWIANYVKETIYSKSNNIVLLTIIESIGMHFENELPGYALDLATSIELVHWDTTIYMFYKKNPTKELLERQILKTMGIPELKDRYELDKKCDLSIQEYVSHTQIYFDSMVQDKCYGILDYLYSIIKNDAENAQDYLQIQKMDMRGAKATKITDNIIMLEPQISGEAEKIVLRQEEFNKPKQRLNAAIKKCNDNMVSGQIDLPSTLDAIKVILELMKDTDMAFQYENLLILFIASAINHQELENEKREKFCTIWINGILKEIIMLTKFLMFTKNMKS